MSSDLFSHALIRDVAIVPTTGESHPAWDEHPPAGPVPVPLTDEIRIEQAPDGEAYLDACEARGLNFNPTRQFGQRYAFVREPAPSSSGHGWDPDLLIQTALQLSRYVVLNSHGTEYAARRIQEWTPGSDEIAPLEIERRYHAYRVPTVERDWLSHEDAEELGQLLRKYLDVRDRLPGRVTRAMVRCEHSFQSPYTEVATTQTVTALEALLKTQRYQVTAQFKLRVPAVARAVGLVGVTRRRAERFYNARSRGVHGEPMPITMQSPATRELRVMQLLLTRTLRRAIEDPAFRAVFSSGPSVARRWPV